MTSERTSGILLAAGVVMCLGLGSYRWWTKTHPGTDFNVSEAWPDRVEMISSTGEHYFMRFDPYGYAVMPSGYTFLFFRKGTNYTPTKFTTIANEDRQHIEAGPVIESQPASHSIFTAHNSFIHHDTAPDNGLPPNVVIRSDGTHFAWDDTNPNRLWDSTLAAYGLHVKFNTYQEALDSAKKYVSEMNADAERARKRDEEVKKGQDVASWPILK